MAGISERLAALETLVATLDERLAVLEAEVVTGEGIQPRQAVRSRLHRIESERLAALTANAALSALKAERRADRNVLLTKLNIGIAATAVIGTPLLTYFLR